ncbi:uncharacterized protein LOC106711810 [Papilio machaon]|uniref:uncharacterized protein LOC106711810 n=1 Tax=Papilio machaon TaxID=76193 RepID=UPI001E663AAA|nr:uncharacterized protein LOC106711810 [Papilio machaon]
MENSLVNSILNLYKERNWRSIVSEYHDHPERSKLLWVFPDEKNFEFLRDCVIENGCDSIISVGCGSGLLEWMIIEATGLPVTGIEVDHAWWQCKYAPPTFIPLILTSPTIDNATSCLLQNAKTSALLFCYFNNRLAFAEYMKTQDIYW